MGSHAAGSMALFAVLLTSLVAMAAVNISSRFERCIDCDVNSRFHFAVTIIIPVFNRAQYVTRALFSAMNQTLRRIDILVIDDCSTDDSVAVVKRVRRRYHDKRVRLIELERNRGTHFVRATGVMSAYGEYILSLDPDDEMLSDAAEFAYAAGKQNDADVVAFKCLQRKWKGGKLGVFPYFWSRIYTPVMNQSQLLDAFIGKTTHWSLAMRCIRTRVYRSGLRLLPPDDLNAHIIFAEDALQFGMVILRARTQIHVKRFGFIYSRYLEDNTLARDKKNHSQFNENEQRAQTILNRTFWQEKGRTFHF